MKIFLDLEETIIESWSNPLLMNVGKIGNFVHTSGVQEVGIFSFAIWNEQDKIDFEERHIKQAIEMALGVPINEILTVPDIANEVFWKTGVRMDISEFITIWGKQRAFIDWALITQRNENRVVLIDDVVRNIDVIDRDRNLLIELINVEKL